jgi:hypothetical protein
MRHKHVQDVWALLLNVAGDDSVLSTDLVFFVTACNGDKRITMDGRPATLRPTTSRKLFEREYY